MGYRPEAGLLAPGTTLPRLPGTSSVRWLRTVALRWASPVTVAGPRRILTGLPLATDR